MFGSFGAAFSSFGAGISGLSPVVSHLVSRFTFKTRDGKTLLNGVKSSEFEGLLFDGETSYVEINSASGVDLTANNANNLGSCVITSTFIQETAGTQVIHACGNTSYRLRTQNGYFRLNNSDTNIFAAEQNKLYRSTITYNADGSTSSFVLENLTDSTTETNSTSTAAGGHGSPLDGFQIGARQGTNNFDGKISNVSVTDSSVGANFTYNFSANSGGIVYDQSGNGNNGTIYGGALWNRTQGELTDVNCLSFDGSDDVVDTGVLASGDSGTFLIKIEATDQGAYSEIMSSFDTSLGGLTIRFHDSLNRPYFISENLGSSGTGTLSGWADGSFKWVAGIWEKDGANTNIAIYLPENSFYESTTYSGAVQHSAKTVKIGARGDESEVFPYFTGGVAEARIYDVALTTAQIDELIETDLILSYPLAEGSGTKAYDVSGNGNHGEIDGATWTTEDGIESWNHDYGFDSDIFKGYAGYWDVTASGSGTWVVNESNLTLTGNITTSPRLRQTVEGMESGDTLVVSGTAVQTGGSGNNNDLYISSASAGWTQESVALGGQQGGTYNFSTTLNANSTTCDITLVALNNANVVISDLKFEVVKKIPALNTKTKQVATFDGVDDYVNTGIDADTAVTKASFTINPVDNGDNRIVLALNNAGGSGNASTYIDTNQKLRYKSKSGGQVNICQTTPLTAGSTYDVVIDYETDVVTINGVTQSFTQTTGFTHGGSTILIGARYNNGTLSKFYAGEIHSLKLETSSGVLAEYDFQNDIGTTTVQDLTTNDNDGTVTVGSGGTESFWGTRVADDDGELVSADYATGNTSISNPAGFVHNNSECGVKLQSRTVGTFDGSDDYVDTGLFPNSNFSLEIDFKFNVLPPVSTKIIAGSNDGENHRFYIGANSNGYQIGYGNGFSSVTGTVDTNRHTLKFEGGKLYLDGSGTALIDISTNSFDETSEDAIGIANYADNSSRHTNITVFSVKIKDGSNLIAEYNFSEAQGNTIYDRSGNDNNGSLTVGSSGLETFWADSYREYSASNLFSHTNGTNNTWVKESGSNITQIGQYDEDETLTSNEDTRNDRYFGN